MNLLELIEITNITYERTSSYRVIASKQNELLDFIKPETDITKIDYKIIQSYIDFLYEKQNKPATINSKLAYLRSILNYAYHNGLIKNKPYIPTIKNKATKTLYFSDTEVDEMLLYTEEHQLRELQQVILIGLNLGLRISEILAIDPEINIQDNYYRSYNNKTQEEFSIPLNLTMQELFNNSFTKFTMNYQAIQYQFKQMLSNLNIKDKTIHTLRHTYCSRLVQKDVALPVIKVLANHKNIQTTMRYTHISNKQLEKAVEML